MRSPAQDGRACPLCGGLQFELMDSWEVGHSRNPATIELGFWQCDCTLALLHPIPTPEQLPDEGKWWSQSRNKQFRRPKWKKVRAAIQNAFFGSPRQRLIRQTAKIQRHGSLVDIGSGAGELLAEAGKIYERCVGIEPETNAVEATRQRGFNVINGTLEQIVTNEKFEVATMDAVLEHLLDPVAALSQVNQFM